MSAEKTDRKKRPVWIEVSRDHFNAYLYVKQNVEPTLSEIKQLLREEKISYGVKDDEKINIFLNNMELYDYTLAIASGRPFTQGKDAQIELNYESGANRSMTVVDMTSDERVDFRKVGTIASVKAGDVIAKKIPAEQGQFGMTVYGQELPGEWGMDITLNSGENVVVSDDGYDYVSQLNGAPILSASTIRVDPVFIVEGDVDYDSGNIVFDGTVAIKGSVLDGFDVKARGDIIVENTIQSATVEAGGDIVVKRGILTRGKGIVYAEGNVYAKFIENSVVEAEGNIVVENAILNSKVYSNKRIVALTEEGAIIGGQILAFDRVICRNLGSQAHPSTYVQVGYRFDVQRKYLEMSGQLRALQKKMTELQKNYEYASKGDSEDLDKLGEIRGKLLKMDRVKKQMQDDLVELSAVRIFNNLSMIEVEKTLFQGVTAFLDDHPYIVKKERTYASLKWDIEAKKMYLTSFDESGREMRKDAQAHSRSVLIIDDSKAVRRTLHLIFERMGLNVLDEAEDGEIGLEKFKKLRPNLVTCDIAMVNMNGLETLQAIRKENPNAKVIMISSNKDKKKVLDCVVSGAYDYILKPFVPERVMTVVKGALES